MGVLMRKILIITMLYTLLLTGCGGGGSSDNSDPVDPPITVTGQFVDAAVKGLGYDCSSGSTGLTDQNGWYTCNEGDDVTFSLGSVTIGNTIAATASIITPLDLFSTENDNTAATNFARLLQSLNLSQNVNPDLIDIDIALVNLIPAGLDFTATSFDADVETALGITLVSGIDAVQAMLDSIFAVGGTIVLVDRITSEEIILTAGDVIIDDTPSARIFAARDPFSIGLGHWLDQSAFTIFPEFNDFTPIIIDYSLRATITMSDTSLIKGETSQVTIVFTKAVKDFSNADVTARSGTLDTLTTLDKVTWKATFTPTDSIFDNSNAITVKRLNFSTDATPHAQASGDQQFSGYIVDTLSPTATITMSDTSLIKGETSKVTIQFTESVKGFSNADVTVTNGTLSNLLDDLPSNGATWFATFTPTDSTSDTSNVISLADTYTDLLGNTGTVSSSANYTVDTVEVVIPPTAPTVSPINVNMVQGTTQNIILLGADVNGDSLTYSVVDDTTSGTLAITDDTASYTPDSSFSGNDSFTYKANDGALDSNIETVSITVIANEAPSVSAIATSTNQNTGTVITLLGTDADDNMLTYSVVDDPTSGTVTITDDSATYTPNLDFVGSDSFTYKANDGVLDSSTTETVSITVMEVINNSTPSVSPIIASTIQNTAVTVTLLGSDVDGDTLTYSVVDDPTSGTVAITEDSATYTPDNDFVGSDSFTYKANDGIADSSTTETVSITVTTPITYAVGDTGPAGGIVIYISNGGINGIEAAPADLSGNYEFGCLNVDIGTTGAMPSAIGTGLANTLEIIAAGCTPSVGTNQIAAVAADAYTLNGFDDWYLPSIDELKELYSYVLNTGAVNNEFYWSSSESDLHNFATDPPTAPLLVKVLYFGPEDFGVLHELKDGGTVSNGYPEVRPVRSF